MDTSKFFNRKSSIRNPKAPYKKGKSIEESSNYKSRIFSRVKETKTIKTLLNIRTNVFRIENLLKANSDLENKSAKVQQKYKLIELQGEKDKKKKSKPSKSSGLGNIIERPKTGAMDWIKNFVTYTFLGWLFTNLQPLISKLEVLGPILQGAFDFLGGTVKFLLDGFASFVKFGYDTKDFITQKSDEIKQQAQGLKQNFDNTLAELKNVVDGTVDAVVSYLEVIDKNMLAQAQQQSGGDSGSGIPPLPSVPSTDASRYKPTISAPQFGPIKGVSTGGIIGYAEGGNIEENERMDPRDPITRGIETSKKKDKFLRNLTEKQQTVPGKNVGGEKKIKELYGEENNNFLGIFSSIDRNKKSGFNALAKSSEELKKPSNKDFLGLGAFSGAIVDVSLGQKPDKRVYDQFAGGLHNFIDYAASNPKEFTKKDIENLIYQIIDPKIESALDKIRNEINKTSSTSSDGSTSGGGGSPTGGDGGNIESINMQGFSAEDVDALGRIIAAEAGGENSIGKAAVMAVILNRYRLIKSGTSPSQFGIRGKTKDEVTLRDVIFASGQFSPVSDGSFGRTSSSSGKAALAAAIGVGGNDPEKLKRELIKSGLNEYDADHVVRSTFFSNPQTRSVVPFPGQKEVPVGRHSFQQSANVRLRGRIGAIEADVKEIKFDAKLQPGMFKPILGDSGVSQGSKPLSVPYSPFTSSQGNPRISSGKGWRWGREHKGLDIEANPGTPMYAYLPGKIVFSGNAGAYGYRVEWKDSNGNVHSYSHMQSNPGFRVGQKIEQGQLIGYVGSTGRSTGPHLHWEIQNSRGSYLDPVQWTKQNPLPKPKEIKLAKENGKEGIIVDGKWEPKQWTPDERKKFNDAKTPQAKVKPKAPSWKTPGRLTDEQARDLIGDIATLKKGDPPLIIPGIGKIKRDNDNTIRYYNNSGNEITRKQFNELMEKYKNPIKKKYGGLVYKPGTTPVLPEQKYASYNDPFNNGIIAIQPIYIQQPVPIPVGGGSGGMIAFSTPKVNNMDNYQQLMRE